jgi:hypothetical protein
MRRLGLLSRLERLELRIAATTNHIKVRLGELRRLPPDYEGEKHIVVAKHLGENNGFEDVEFEEVPGPDPATVERAKDGRRYFNVVLIGPAPMQEPAA